MTIHRKTIGHYIVTYIHSGPFKRTLKRAVVVTHIARRQGS